MSGKPQIDMDDPDRNMFGVRKCPECGSDKRWPTQPVHPKHPNCILCDDCGFIEPLTPDVTHVAIRQLHKEVMRERRCGRCGGAMAHYRLHGWRCLMHCAEVPGE